MRLTLFLFTCCIAPVALADRSKDGHGCPDIASPPLTTSELASVFSPLSHNDPAAIESIRSTLALYPLALDSRNYDALDKVFTEDAIANSSAPIFVVSGLSNIKAAIAPLLAVYSGTHTLSGTQVIDVCSHDTAISVTYFTTTHFLSSNFAGVDQFQDSDILYAYGRYEDTLSRQNDDTWRIKYRKSVYMVSHCQAGRCCDSLLTRSGPIDSSCRRL